MSPPDQYLSIAEASARANRPESDILAWIKLGLPYVPPRPVEPGRRRPRKETLRIRASALDMWMQDLETRQATPRAAKGRQAPARGRGREPADLGAWRRIKGVG